MPSDPAVRDDARRPFPRVRPGHPPARRQEVAGDYEAATGAVIVETLTTTGLDPLEMPAVLVASHGPFTWGPDPEAAADNAIALEAVAAMAIETLALDPGAKPMADDRCSTATTSASTAPRPTTGSGGDDRRHRRVADVARLHGKGDVRLAREATPTPGHGRGPRSGHGGRPVRLGPALVSRGRDRRCGPVASARPRSRVRRRHPGRAAGRGARRGRPGRPVRPMRSVPAGSLERLHRDAVRGFRDDRRRTPLLS